MTIKFVCFYKVVFQHLGLLAKTWVLRFVLKGSPFRSSLSGIFPEEAQKFSAKYISCQFMRKLLRFLLPLNLLGGLLPCFQVVRHFQTVQSLEWSDLILRVPLMVQCLQRFLDKTDFWLQAAYWKVWYLTYFLLVSWRIRFRRVASLLFDRISGVSVFHHIMWRWEDKMEVIEEFVSNVLLSFNYRLTLSRSDFAKIHTC